MSSLPVQLLGETQSSSAFQAYLSNVGASSSTLERKDYLSSAPPISYRNLKSCGVSFQFQRSPQAVDGEEGWTCAAVDVYNADALDQGAKHKCGYAAFRAYPLRLRGSVESPRTTGAASGETKEAPPTPTGTIDVTPHTTAREFVRALGEPLRKGGGEALAGGGASGLGPGVWLEWKLRVRIGQAEEKEVMLMVELAGNEARGAGRWEAGKAGRATWGILTLSLPDQ